MHDADQQGDTSAGTQADSARLRTAKASGLAKWVTGHAARVSGARRMARAGIKLWQIQLFARWGSSAILRYVREAPLEKSHRLARNMWNVRGLDELVDDLRAAKGATELHASAHEVTKQLVTEHLDAKFGEDWGAKVTEGDLKTAVLEVDVADAGRAEARLCLPKFVVSVSHRGGRAHRPRDACHTFCGWACKMPHGARSGHCAARS